MLITKQVSAVASRRPEKLQYVPLKRVSVEATVRSFAANVTIKQVFRNDHKTASIEAVYCFPIEEQAAIYAFAAHIEDREIVAQLKEKKQAQKEYSGALRQSHGAYLLEQDEKSQDNFIINVGALPPGKECHISISYVIELDLVENGTKIRFVVPTTIAPRYNPDERGIGSPGETTSKYVQASPYTIEFRCRVDKVGIAHVRSSSHPIPVDVSQPDSFVIELAVENTYLDRDILLDIELDKNYSHTIASVESDAVMAAFTPTDDNSDVTNEFIFVVDCSRSMEDDNKIGRTRQAMLLFLKSLPVHCHFNIIRFGSNHQTLFQDVTAVYDEENTRKAEQLINELKADLGGTELLNPLQWLEDHAPEQGRVRQIFLLTDGQISNVDQVVDLCRTMATSTRIFSFGLGHSPSHSLVKGVARATNGRFVFIPSNSNVDVCVGEQLQKALQSCLTNVEIKWNLGTSVVSVPTKTPPVYTNDRLIAYALADDPTSAFDHDSSVELYTDQHRLDEAKVNCVPNVSSDGTIARLAAKALILELQHFKLPSVIKKKGAGLLQTRLRIDHLSSTTTKRRIVDLSLKHGILSSYTNFVGIEKRTNESNGEMELREVPIEILACDQYLETSQNMSCCGTRRGGSEYSMGSKNRSRTYRCQTNSPRILSSLCINVSIPGLEEHHGISYEGMFACDTTSFDENRFANEGILQRFKTKEKEETWPTTDDNIVRYLIKKQKFDGLWNLGEKEIEQLTGQPLSSFSQHIDPQVLLSTIVVVTLKTQFNSLSMLWYGVVQKAHKRLFELLNKDGNKLDSLLENIRQQLSTPNTVVFT